jgi:hypothetical protein
VVHSARSRVRSAREEESEERLSRSFDFKINSAGVLDQARRPFCFSRSSSQARGRSQWDMRKHARKAKR